MNRLLATIFIFACSVLPSIAAADEAALRVFPPEIGLETARDRQSFVVQLQRPDGVTRDVTAECQISLADPKLAKIESNALTPLADGQTNLLVTHEGKTVPVPVFVKSAAAEPPTSFKLDVMPVFLKSGCNSGSCHGAARGKDGFRLSLFGYDPDGDYNRITREIATRRINLALPAESLLLQKSIGAVQHTGGSPVKAGSPQYNAMLKWIEGGANQDSESVAKPVSLELLPKQALLEQGTTHRMTVRAKYSDGTDRDVTSLALFMSNNDTSAKISPDGLVTAGSRGEAFVMARFATFTVGSQIITVPKNLQYQWSAGTPANNYVDGLVNAKLKKLRILPSDLCDDGTFLRRAYVDIVGQLPSREAFEKFTADSDPKKREKLVDELLNRREFVDLWVMKFAELLQIRTIDNQVSYKGALLYFNWLGDRISNNVPMDQIVRELISADGGTFKNPPSNFYQVELDPLKLAEDTAQVFMGMRIQCAQCHNHPFDRWTQDDYYGFVSFFTQVGRKPAEDPREKVIFNSGGGEHPHPVTNKPVPPRFLGSAQPADVSGKDRRQVLADWLASPENPYFAKNLSNIVWAHFMGKGIIDPVDDVRVSNPASNPELLDELAKRFTSYKYDFKRLVRDICTSRTYQLSTRANDTNAGDTRNFARGNIRRIRAEVLLDCITQVTEGKQKFQGLPLGARAVQIANGNTSNYFLTTFGRSKRDSVCSCEVKMEPNLSQALHLLNGDTVNNQVTNGPVIPEMLKQKLTPEQVIEELYVRCLTRKPSADETHTIVEMLKDPGVQPRQVYTDLFWALLNSQEFMFNH